MTDKTKTSGAMVLVPTVATDAMISALFCGTARNMDEARKCWANALAIAPVEDTRAMVEQTPAVGGEPVMRLEAEKLIGGDGEYAVDFVKPGWLKECREAGGTFLLYSHEYVAPLLAEIERLKDLATRRKDDQTQMCTDLVDAHNRIAELEAQQGEPVAYVDSSCLRNLKMSGFESYSALLHRDQADITSPQRVSLYRQAQAATAKLEMADIVRAHMEIPQCPVLTSNQCHSLAVKLNAVLSK